MNNLRYTFLVGGVFSLALGFVFVIQIPSAVAIWPWLDGQLTYLFIGSILAAVSVAMLWIGWAGEWGALPAGSLNVLVIAVTTTGYFFYLVVNSRPELMPYVIAGILSVIASATIFLQSRKIPLSDQRPTPWLVHVSLWVFTIALVLAGGALVLRIPIFPWELKPDSSVIFGCIFLGDAFYFLYGLLKPRWHNALGQLLSFLAYDLVLIVPFLTLFQNDQT